MPDSILCVEDIAVSRTAKSLSWWSWHSTRWRQILRKEVSIYSMKVTSVMKKNAAKKGTGYFTVGKEGKERLQFKRLPSMSR